VRIPILERVRDLARTLRDQQGLTLAWSLSAASVGADRLNASIAAVTDEADLPEVFLSAGFESFFDQTNLRRFKDAGTFVDLAPAQINADLAGLGLRDPGGHFTMVGIVPAVFLINEQLLNGEPAPRSWEELLEPRFENRISLPVGDFDLFNGILLNLYRRFGDDGVRALSRNMLASLHPSQTVGRFSTRQAQQPAVSIIPYFFSKMTLKTTVIRTAWPTDGAIICPIFMLVKRSALPAVQPVADAFLSREVGEVLAHRGLFPVLHPEVDNRLPAEARFQWLGWDFIEQHDLGQLIPRLDGLFRASAPALQPTEVDQ
jgi:ABC-type Fe3+ transport system substrate-binding protein